MTTTPAADQRPLRPWHRRYTTALLREDLSAGTTVAVLLVPQALAYAALAGLPPVTGLYTALGALVAYALLGTSPYVSAGPSAVTALLVVGAVAPLADGDPGRAVVIASALALLVGAVRLALGLLRAGGIINVVSQPVLTGFTAGAGVIIGLTQVGDLLGMDAERAGQVPAALAALAEAAGTIRPSAAVVGLGALALLLLGRRFLPNLPVPLLVVAAAAGVIWLLDMGTDSIPLVGTVPRGLPVPSLPWDGLQQWRQLVTPAIVLALVGYVEGVSVAKAFAVRDRQRIDPNTELVAHGAAAVAAGLLGGFANGGSFSRSALANRAGARSTTQSLVAAVLVVASLLALADVLALIPQAVLAAIVLYAVSGLFDLEAAREAIAVDRADAIGLAAGFLAPLVFGVDLGFLLAAVTGLLLQLYSETLPRVTELGLVTGTEKYRNIQRWDDVGVDPRVVVLRLEDSLTFLNADAVSLRLTELMASREGLQVVVLNLSGVARVDATGIGVLRELLAQSRDGNITLRLANLRGPVRDVLVATRLWPQAQPLVHPSVEAAVASAGIEPGSPLRTTTDPDAPD